jgi:hypothetical protein
MFLESFSQEHFWYILGASLNIIFNDTLDSILFDFLLNNELNKYNLVMNF